MGDRREGIKDKSLVPVELIVLGLGTGSEGISDSGTGGGVLDVAPDEGPGSRW